MNHNVAIEDGCLPQYGIFVIACAFMEMKSMLRYNEVHRNFDVPIDT